MPAKTIAAIARNGTNTRPIAAVELPDSKMPFTESAPAAMPPAMPDQNAQGASGRALRLTRSSIARLESLDDTKIPVHAVVAEDLQSLLVARAVVRGKRLRHALELDHHYALGQALFVNLRGISPHDEASARCLDGGRSDLRVRRERVLVLDGVVKRDPIAFCHMCVASVIRPSLPTP